MSHDCEGLFCRTCSLAEQERGTRQALESRDIGEWRGKADLWFKLLPGGESFTSETLTEAVGLPRDGHGMNANNAVGAFIRGLVRSNKVDKVGPVASLKRSSHGRTITMWRKR